MEKMPPAAKFYEALSAVADQRIKMHEDHAEVMSSDGAKCYTVQFLKEGYTCNDNATLWQHYPGYPILAVMILQGKLKITAALLPEFQNVNWKQLNTRYKNNYDQAIEEFLRPFTPELCAEIEQEICSLTRQLEGMALTIKGNRQPRTPQ